MPEELTVFKKFLLLISYFSLAAIFVLFVMFCDKESTDEKNKFKDKISYEQSNSYSGTLYEYKQNYNDVYNETYNSCYDEFKDSITDNELYDLGYSDGLNNRQMQFKEDK